MILYIHPKTQMFLRSLLPMSLPALINRLPRPVLGLFEDEVTRDDLLKARIVLMDIQWYLSIHSAIKLSRKIKTINPKTVIIAGGLSASIFCRQILRNSEIDYIVRGDAEIPLKELVEAILNHSDTSKVPNLARRNFSSILSYSLTVKDMNESDYRDISFFPSLQNDVFKLHNTCHGYPLPTYPFLTTFRGCQTICKGCHGIIEMQKILFNRYAVIRSKEKVKEDLAVWSKDPRIAFVNIHLDFITSLPEEYSTYVLEQCYNLYVLYEFFRMPSKQQLNLLNKAFKGGTIAFPIDKYHSTSQDLSDPKTLIDRIHQAQDMKKFDVRLYYVKRFAAQNPKYKQTLLQVKKNTGCTIARADYWWEDTPIPNKQGLCEEKDYQYLLKQHNRYIALNTVLRAGELLHRYLPGPVELAARYTRKLL